jgi:hypothetical protein
MTILDPNWTQGPEGHTNASPEYQHIVAHVERLIRNDAASLIAGRADITARLIVSHLAHVYGMVPDKEALAAAMTDFRYIAS